MKKVIFAILLAAPAAYAQETPAEGPNPITEPAEHKETAEDPSAHFNWAHDWFSYKDKDEYGGKLGDGTMTDSKTGETVHEEEPMSAPFVFALLNFALLLLILNKYLAPAGRKVAEERHDQIKVALDEAAKLRNEAAKKLSEYETRIAGVDAEIDKLVAGIRADAEADKKRILENAEKQAAQMKKDAEQRIAAEIEIARAHLAEEVASASAAAAAKLLRDKATNDDQKRLVSTFISGLGGR